MANNLQNNGRKVGFDAYEIHVHSQELFKHGVRIKLAPQAFRVLLILVQRPGELVSREELRRELWPDDTFVDFDHGLNNAIRKIRDALNDGHHTPRYIETLPRLGYRFIGPVNGRNGDGVSPAEADVAETTEGKGASASTARPTFLGANGFRIALLLLLLASVSAAYVVWRGSAHKSALEIVPLTSLPGQEKSASFSPDGEEVAFDYEDATGRNIFTKRIDGEKMVRLTDGPGLWSCPSWSPDGKWIAYLEGSASSSFNLRNGIYLMNPSGGAKRKLLDVENVSCRLAWSPDSKTLLYGPAWSSSETGGLFLVDIENPIPRKLLSSPPNTVDAYPAYSWDGKKIAFARSTSLGTADLYVAAVFGGEAQRITNVSANLGGPAWMPDGKQILFWGSTAGSGWNNDIYVVPSVGGLPQLIPLGPHNEGSPAISRDGKRLAYQQFQFDSNIWRVNLSEKTPTATNFIGSTWVEHAPDFSMDGTKIAFVSERDGTLAIWICNSDCVNPTRLMGPDGPNIPRWSPSGGEIAFDARSNGHRQIFVVDARGGAPRQLTSGAFESQAPSWSANGEWIYFGSDRSGSYEIWKTSLLTKEAIQVTHNGGLYAEESRDGKFVFYNKPQDRMATWTYVKSGVYQLPVNGGREELVVPEADWLWRAGKDGIYYTNNAAKPKPALMRYTFATRKRETLANLDRAAWGGPGGLAVSPDGRTILYTQVDADGSDLMLVKNLSW